jgi:hypothetical protein
MTFNNVPEVKFRCAQVSSIFKLIKKKNHMIAFGYKILKMRERDFPHLLSSYLRLLSLAVIMPEEDLALTGTFQILSTNSKKPGCCTQ